MRKTIVGGILSLCAAILFYGSPPTEAKNAAAVTVKGVVEDGSKQKLANATVWLIPAADVVAMAKTPVEVKADSPNDEPLEDNLAANRSRYLNAKSNDKGEFSVAGVSGDRFFLYVEPADNRYLPGGDKSRIALSLAELSAAPLKIKVSGNVSADATYVGTSACLECHDDHETFKSTLHRLGIHAVGKDSKLQDSSRFPEFNNGLNKLMAGSQFWFYGFDKTRSFDKYQISDNAPADLSSVSFTTTFFKDG